MFRKITTISNRQLLKRQNLFVNCNIKNSSNVKVAENELTKESLQWRIPWNQTKGEWYSRLKVFASDHNNTDIQRFLQTPVNMSPSSIKKWWNRKKEETEIIMQQYIPERNQILGDDLAAAHFIVHRGGAVKFLGEENWIKRDENMEYTLPTKYVPDKILEAVDCSNMMLYYEGLINLGGLRKVEWLSLNNCKAMDDWCMDRIAGMFQDNLSYMDIRNCKNITDRGVSVLYKLRNLKTLYVDDVSRSKSFEYTCLLLEELLPNLKIKM